MYADVLDKDDDDDINNNNNDDGGDKAAGELWDGASADVRVCVATIADRFRVTDIDFIAKASGAQRVCVASVCARATRRTA